RSWRNSATRAAGSKCSSAKREPSGWTCLEKRTARRSGGSGTSRRFSCRKRVRRFAVRTRSFEPAVSSLPSGSTTTREKRRLPRRSGNTAAASPGTGAGGWSNHWINRRNCPCRASLTKILLGQGDPVGGPHRQDLIVEDVLRVVDHRRVAIAQKAVGALLLLQHEGEVLAAQVARSRIHHRVIAERSACALRGPGGFGWIVHQHGARDPFPGSHGCSHDRTRSALYFAVFFSSSNSSGCLWR